MIAKTDSGARGGGAQRAGIHRAAVLTLLCWGLAACDGQKSDASQPDGPQPDGQVVATLPGGEITRFELRNEPFRAGEAPAQVLERVIDRKLLAEVARQRHVEDDPAYLAGLRRLREELLVDLLRRQVLRDAGMPDAAALATFARERPWAFAQRQVIDLVPAIAADGSLKEGQPGFAPTDPGASSALVHQQVDTARLDRAHWQLLARAGAAVTLDGQSFRIVSRTIAPMDVVLDRDYAIGLWQQHQLELAFGKLLGAARGQGLVRYSQGMGPSAR